MPITLNDFKYSIVLYGYKDKEDIYGNIRRKRRKIKTVWAALKPSNTSVTIKNIPKNTDGTVTFQRSYHLYLREHVSFDEVEWRGEIFFRASSLQEEGVFQKCLISQCEEKVIGTHS